MVSIIIPNYNGVELLRKNLPFVIKAGDNPDNKIKDIIIVDDGSKDGSVELIKKEFPRVKLIRHTKNRGFSSAINTGVRASKGVLIALLNTDVVPSGNFLEAAVRDFKDKSVFGVSFHEKGYGWGKGVFRNGVIEHDPGEEGEVKRSTFWVSGGSGIFRRDLWFELGGLDEILFSPFYWEDVDLSYRALKRGYKLFWEPMSHVRHEHESTIKKIPARKRNLVQERNQLFFIWKNLTSSRMFRRHLAGLLSRFLKHPGYIVVIIFALSKISSVLKARHKNVRQQKISDEAVFDSFK